MKPARIAIVALIVTGVFALLSWPRHCHEKGSTQFEAGHYAEALAEFSRCATIARWTFAKRMRANCLTGVAAASTEVNDLPAAERAIREVIEIDKTTGESPRATAAALVELGITLHRQKRSDEAMSAYREALSLQESSLGPEHESVSATLLNLGALELETGKPADGKKKLERALAIKQKVLGADDPSVAIVHFNLGVAAEKSGALPEALAQFRRSLEIRRKVLSSDHPLTIASRKAVADLQAAVATSSPAP